MSNCKVIALTNQKGGIGKDHHGGQSGRGFGTAGQKSPAYILHHDEGVDLLPSNIVANDVSE